MKKLKLKQYEDRRISILAGVEEVARKMPGGPWQVKVGHCQFCGVCCGDCEHLVIKEGYPGPDGWARMCALGWDRPTACTLGDDEGEEHCSIVWKTG